MEKINHFEGIFREVGVGVPTFNEDILSLFIQKNKGGTYGQKHEGEREIELIYIISHTQC